jgi:hypothetical protein
MSKTLQKTKLTDGNTKPYISVQYPEKVVKRGASASGAHRTYIVKKRLMDEKNLLWGFLIESNGETNRVTSEVLYNMMVRDIPVVVDWTGKDKPATLAVVHERTERGMQWYFRTIADKFSKNNLNKVPVVKSQSSHLRKYPRITSEDV